MNRGESSILAECDRQRICIAWAIAGEPEFIICDESVSALDVSVQAQILNLLKDLQQRRGLTYVFISHDLNVVKFRAAMMAMMNAGQLMEVGPSKNTYAQPNEEYTRRLMDATPSDDLGSIQRWRFGGGPNTCNASPRHAMPRQAKPPGEPRGEARGARRGEARRDREAAQKAKATAKRPQPSHASSRSEARWRIVCITSALFWHYFGICIGIIHNASRPADPNLELEVLEM